jgi:DNA processing protein
MIGVGRAGPRRGSEAALSTGATGSSGVDLRTLDPDAERPYWIAISLVPGVGPIGYERILERFGSARAAWAAGAELLTCLPRVPPDAAAGLRALRRRGATQVARRVEADVRRAGGEVLTTLDPEYPPALRAGRPRPAVLYRAGDPESFERPAVAIVGTRRATGYGRSVAQELSDELARAGVTVVSGLALGIDGEAHAAALAAGDAAALETVADGLIAAR